MKLHQIPVTGSGKRNRVKDRFMVLVDDVDGDEAEATFFETEPEARAYVEEQWGDIPDTTEEDGNTYGPGETPNTHIRVGRVVKHVTIIETIARTVL